jgi:hypothetical protein
LEFEGAIFQDQNHVRVWNFEGLRERCMFDHPAFVLKPRLMGARAIFVKIPLLHEYVDRSELLAKL